VNELFYSREQRAKRACLHAHLATAARVKYPAALQCYKFDAPLLTAGYLTQIMNIWRDLMLVRRCGFYEKYIKRVLDIICSLLAIIVFFWLYIIIAVIVRINMGTPVLFKQSRPGQIGNHGRERIFDMYKFRTMTDERDEQGNLLPDEQRLPKFGNWLRSTSLDELPEVFNILKGDMSIIGPRPQLVIDLVFMDDRVRMRHTAKPGLSGLAQVNGRNAVTWEQKFEWDLKYIEKVSFWNDLKIIGLTVKKVFLRSKTAGTSETDVADDYGDWLLKTKKVSKTKYAALQAHARNLIKEYEGRI
jgi:lipopolysaccharide/colanic/teichoic acid biosynthesis glycosyltransferase